MKLTALVDVPASVLNQALVLENTKLSKKVSDITLQLQGNLFANKEELSLLIDLMKKIAPIAYDKYAANTTMTYQEIRRFINLNIPQLLA